MDIMLTFDEEFTLESAKRMLEEKYIEAVKSEDINNIQSNIQDCVKNAKSPCNIL